MTPSLPGEDLSADKLLAFVPRDSQGRPLLGGIPLTCRLGRGGMGAVYYAIHPRLQVEVAVKILPFTLVEQDPKLIDRFISEARMAASLASDHVVRVLDVNQERDTHYLVMEYVAGESAGAYLKRVKASGRAALTEAEAVAIVRAATRGLAAAHKRGIIHRDIKPDNIMIPKGDVGAAKLADLGLAKPEGGGQSLGTASHVAMGTPGYMAPEQVEDAKTAGPPADVFSMGATLYALLSGRAPFTGSSLGVILRDTATKDAEPLPPAVSGTTRAIIDRCLAKDPARRFASGSELLTAIENTGARPSVPPEATPGEATLHSASEITPPPPRRRSRGPAILAAAAVAVAAVVIGVMALRTNRSPSPEQLAIASKEAAEAKARADAAAALSSAKSRASEGDFDRAIQAIEGLTSPETAALREDWTRRSKERREAEEKRATALKDAESMAEAGRLDAALARLAGEDASDPRVKAARARIEDKVRAAKTAAEMREAYRGYMTAADIARTKAEALDTAPAWQNVVEACAKAEGHAQGDEETKAARAIASLATQRWHWAGAREADAKGDLDRAIELAAKAAAGPPSSELLTYQASLVARKKEADARAARKRDFDQWAGQARVEKDALPALALWKRAESFADNAADKAEVAKRLEELAGDIARADAEKRVRASLAAGEAALAAARIDDAEARFKEALALAPGDSQAARGLEKVGAARIAARYSTAMTTAEEAMKAEKFADARASFGEALALKPGDEAAAKGIERVEAAQKAQGIILKLQPRQGDRLTSTESTTTESKADKFSSSSKSTIKMTTTYESVKSGRVEQKTVRIEQWETETTTDGKTTRTPSEIAGKTVTVKRSGDKADITGLDGLPDYWKSMPWFKLDDEASYWPATPMIIGDSYDLSDKIKDRLSKTEGLTWLKCEYKVTLKDVRTIGTRRCAILTYVQHMTSEMQKAKVSTALTSEGEMTIWLDRGYMLSTRSTMKIKTTSDAYSSEGTTTTESKVEVTEK